MHPLIRVAPVVLVVSALGSRAESGAAGSPASVDRSAPLERPERTRGLSAVCPPHTLPDGEVCVPLPEDDDTGGDELSALGASHHDKKGRLRLYEQIPRRPDRPAAYGVYRYPVPIAPGEKLAMSGYDLDLPEDEQRHGRKFSHVGHGGVDLAAPRGTEVRVVALEHQEGDAQVVFAGKLFGTSVVTKHTLREGGRLRDYIVLYGHLDRTADGLLPDSAPLGEGSVVGYVGDTGSVGVVHLHLEVRRVRDGVDLRKVPPERLVANEVSVVCDPRNVLPLR
jgi:murein DD-endopeptidase MepM/ murein hydrolase activator NlpD